MSLHGFTSVSAVSCYVIKSFSALSALINLTVLQRKMSVYMCFRATAVVIIDFFLTI